MPNNEQNYVPLTILWDSEQEEIALYLDYQTQWATDLSHAAAYFEGHILVMLADEDSSGIIMQ